MRNVFALLPALLFILAMVWALWLIFKRNILEQGVFKVLIYFVGVILTFLFVGWIVVGFLPGWSARLLNSARESEEVEAIEVLGRQIWQEAVGEVPEAPPPPTPTLSAGPTPAPTEPPTAPTPGPTVSPVGEPGIGSQGEVRGEVRYEVQQGDTLNNIARRFNVSTEEIQTRNGLWNPNVIYPGDILIIPAQ
jgi:hypothetical protein